MARCRLGLFAFALAPEKSALEQMLDSTVRRLMSQLSTTVMSDYLHLGGSVPSRPLSLCGCIMIGPAVSARTAKDCRILELLGKKTREPMPQRHERHEAAGTERRPARSQTRPREQWQ